MCFSSSNCGFNLLLRFNCGFNLLLFVLTAALTFYMRGFNLLLFVLTAALTFYFLCINSSFYLYNRTRKTMCGFNLLLIAALTFYMCGFNLLLTAALTFYMRGFNLLLTAALTYYFHPTYPQSATPRSKPLPHYQLPACRPPFVL